MVRFKAWARVQNLIAVKWRLNLGKGSEWLKHQQKYRQLWKWLKSFSAARSGLRVGAANNALEYRGLNT